MKGQMMNKKIRAFVNRLTGRKPAGKAAKKGFPAILRQGSRRAATTFSAYLGASVCISTLVTPASLFALPQDGIVKAGAASMVYSSSRLNVNQTTNKAVIDWRSFNIAASEHTRFNQPSASSMTLNRVTTGDPSSILGTLTANGRVVLVNPNGVFLGPASRVDVGGLVATTADIANEDFMAGNLRFAIPSSVPDAAVINQGTITVHDAGLAALVAPVVANSGVIQARLGKVALASGNTFTLDLYGDNLVQFAVGSTVGEDQAQAAESLVSNSGLISADGGTVLLTASAVGRAVSKVVNMDGIIEARAVEVGQGGEIILHGGDSGIVSVSGTLDASGKDAGQQGGSVQVLGDKVGLFAGAVIDASGDAGGGEVLVGGDFQGANPDIKNATATYVDAAAAITADAVRAGDGGKVIVWADGTTRFHGDISARGGSVSGDGGFVEVSGKEWLSFNGYVSLAALSGEAGNLLLDPDDIIVDEEGEGELLDGVNTDNVYAFSEGVGTKTIAPGKLTEIMDDGTPVTLQANNDITVNTAIDASGSTKEGGGLTLQAGDDVILNAGITTKNGTVSITANAAGATPTVKDDKGIIDMRNTNVSITTGSADITLSAEGQVKVNSLQTEGHISITSTDGSIVDNSSGDGKIIDGGSIYLNASKNIGGSANIRDIDINTTELTAIFGGSIYINNSGDFSLLDLKSTSVAKLNDTNNATFDIRANNLTFTGSADGTKYVLEAVSATPLQSGFALSFEGAGAIEIGTINVGGGAVTLSGTSINDDSANPDTTTDIVASSVSLTALNGIGNNADLDLQTQSLKAVTDNGNIDVNNDSIEDVIVHKLSTGTGSIDFSQTGGGNAIIALASTADGSIDLKVDDGRLDNSGGTITAGGTTGNIVLETTTSGSVILGSLNATDNNVTITSARSINDDSTNPDTTTDIVASSVSLSAVRGIGNNNDLDLQTQSLTAVTDNGNIDVNNVSGTAVTVDKLEVTSGPGSIS
ncbi:MAG: filamentous hemagglutinin N-terminal domain-containing protein, partial [Thermodesulfobacteriota bacterium]